MLIPFCWPALQLFSFSVKVVNLILRILTKVSHSLWHHFLLLRFLHHGAVWASLKWVPVNRKLQQWLRRRRKTKDSNRKMRGNSRGCPRVRDRELSVSFRGSMTFFFSFSFARKCSKLFSTVYIFVSLSDFVVICIALFHLQSVSLTNFSACSNVQRSSFQGPICFFGRHGSRWSCAKLHFLKLRANR